MESKHAIFAGLGWLGKSQEKIEELVEELIERGELTRRDSSKFIRQIMEQAMGEREEFRKVVEEIFHDAAGSVGIATKEELKELHSRLDSIERKIMKIRREEAEKAKPAKKAAAKKKPAAKRKTK